MELIAVTFMLVAGGALAVLVMIAAAVAGRGDEAHRLPSIPERDALAASLLFNVVRAGGISQAEALREVREVGGLAAPVSAGIDIAGWAERYATLVPAAQRGQLLETAVRLAAAPARPLPLMQYVALLDLCFGLGFHADALARLRERYHFDYVDPAKAGRPREADRAGRASFFDRRAGEAEWLAVLGIEGPATRGAIIAAYRQAAVRTHPDRFHESDPAAREAAAARFVELSQAYAALLALHPD